MRAIDADAAGRELKTAALKRENFPQTGLVLVDEIVRYLDTCPTLDVAPVRHGKWVLVGADKRGRGGIWVCRGRDGCGNSYPHKCDYCPNCGAKMDAGQEDDKNA